MPVRTSIILSPTAKALVQVEGRRTISKLYIGQPLRNDVQKSRIESDRSTYQGNDNPALAGLVGLPELVPPTGLASSTEESCIRSSSSFSSKLFSGSILYPVCRKSIQRPMGAQLRCGFATHTHTYCCKVLWKLSLGPIEECEKHTSYRLISSISSSIWCSAPVGAGPPSPSSALDAAVDSLLETDGRF